MSSATEMIRTFKAGTFEQKAQREEQIMQLPQWINRIIVGHMVFMLTLAAGGAWWASSVAKDISYMRDRMEAIEARIEPLIDIRYKATDAAKDFAVRDERIRQMEARLLELERKANGAK